MTPLKMAMKAIRRALARNPVVRGSLPFNAGKRDVNPPIGDFDRFD